MDTIKNVIEYYDELFPVSETQRIFFESYFSQFSPPAKFLSIGCGTGIFEHRLAKNAIDVTALETIRGLLDSATHRYRNQLMALRYFQMSTWEMTNFLGKHFYNIISCLNSRIVFIYKREYLKKFFSDCKELLSEHGIIILGVDNFEKFRAEPKAILPTRKSIRVAYKSQVIKDAQGTFLETRLEKENKVIPVCNHVPIYPLQKNEIVEFAKEAGFEKIEFFSDFEKNPLSEHSNHLLAVIQQP